MYYFLDIDGVLNRKSDWTRPFTLNAECVKNFAELLSHDKNPHVILSSTWRMGETNTGAIIGAEKDSLGMLLEQGIHIEGTTPAAVEKTFGMKAEKTQIL